MPRFTTRIPTSGSDGNIMVIAGTAGHLLRQIGVPPQEITEFYGRVMKAESYDAACAIVEEYFPLDREDD